MASNHISKLNFNFKKDFTLLTLDPKIYRDGLFSLARFAIKKPAAKVLYITFSKQYCEMAIIFKEKGIDYKKFHVLDGVSGRNKMRCTEIIGTCSHLSSPQSLTELSLIITGLLEQRDFNVVIFDSLSSFLIYNNLETTTRFVHYLVNKLKSFGGKGIFIIFKDSKSKELLPIISPFFDAHVDLTK